MKKELKMLTLVKNYFVANRTVLAWTSLPLSLLAGMIFLVEHTVVIPLVALGILYIFSFSKTEEKNRTDVLYCSLPVRKSTIVYSRYLAASFTFVGVITVCFLVFSIIESFNFPGHTLIFPPISVQQFFSAAIFVALFISVFFPFYFKYGYMKGQMLGAAAITLVSAVFVGILYIIVSLSGKTTILDAVMTKTELPRITLFFMGVLAQAEALMGELNFLVLKGIVTVILVFVSVRVSVKFYKNKDL
jgi:ABC-2 type transport system permease protein